MSAKALLWGLALAATSLAAAAQEHSGVPSIVIDRAATQTSKKPLSESERAYWRCVLEYLKGTHSDEAVEVILAACRALHGAR